MDLLGVNEPYYVLRSNKSQGVDGQGDPLYLYLSSDGAGKMKLKLWNKPVTDPPGTTGEVDPALLFRIVRPSGAT